jgi:hypothetical protein
VVLCACAALGCSSPTPAHNDAAVWDAKTVWDLETTEDGQPLSDVSPDPKLSARVFELDPVNTPQPTLVQLDGLVPGPLTSAPNSAGIRRLEVVSCVDKGDTAMVPGQGTRTVCTLQQLVDGAAHGSFVYDDWKQGAAGSFDPDDRFAEVSAYHHASRIYDFVTDARVGLFADLPRRHDVAGKHVPVTVVTNFQAPGIGKLQPSPIGAYFPREFGKTGLYAVQGLNGIEGDALVFGQGAHADFAYSGQTIYHEFGHLVFTALTGAYVYIYGDAQGLCHLTSAVNEGIAETFAWLVSGRAELGKYCDLETGGSGGFRRTALNVNRFPRDISGIFLPDGQIISGANHEAYKLLSVSPHRFARVVMLALQALEAVKGKITFSGYADAFLAALEKDNLGAHKSAIKSIFIARGLYAKERAKDITAYDGTDPRRHMLATAGTSPMGGAYLTVASGGSKAISPAYVQTYVDLPAGKSKLVLEALLLVPGGAPSSGTLDYRIYLRAGKPIHYDVTQTPVEVTFDQELSPTLDKQVTPAGSLDRARWDIKGLTPGTRYYLHVFNRGASQGQLIRIKVLM